MTTVDFTHKPSVIYCLDMTRRRLTPYGSSHPNRGRRLICKAYALNNRVDVPRPDFYPSHTPPPSPLSSQFELNLNPVLAIPRPGG
jgi:hypothetical protein